jgi:flavin-dependent dehydrogenase
MMTLDVVVLGGGPAGAVAALTLARAGWSVAVLERSRYEAQRLGETLPPSAKPLLYRLGVWEAFVAAPHLSSPGIVSVWSDEEPYENDFFFNPYGNGWHLDRRRFDEMLATEAAKHGAIVCRNARAVSCYQDTPGRWQVDVQIDGQLSRLEAQFLVDATGRASWLAQRLGARRIVWDRLVGVVGLFNAVDHAADRDPRMLLEAAKNGWWYSAPLPGARLAVAYMTDFDLLAETPRKLDSFWGSRLEETSHTRRRVGSSARQGDLRTVSANSYRMNHTVGENWLTAGDAAIAWDPLSSQGISKALESGAAAGHAVAEALAGRPGELADYGAASAMGFEEYCRLRARYYGQVRRWPASLFWERRQVQHLGCQLASPIRPQLIGKGQPRVSPQG